MSRRKLRLQGKAQSGQNTEVSQERLAAFNDAESASAIQLHRTWLQDEGWELWVGGCDPESRLEAELW